MKSKNATLRKFYIAASVLSLGLSTVAQSRQGGRNTDSSASGGVARPETITCGLSFNGQAIKGTQSALVQNSQALVQGSSEGVSYLFSVRGKSAVAKLTISETGEIISAKGNIEMLRHGGENRGGNVVAGQNLRVASQLFSTQIETFKNGADDDQDGHPEREGGFELSTSIKDRANSQVTLKCNSQNNHAQAAGQTLANGPSQISSANLSASSNFITNFAAADINTLALPVVVSGCAEANYETSVNPTASIATSGSSYTPRCLKVKVGTSVSIDASSRHPLQGIPSTLVANPIVDDLGGAVSLKTVKFDKPGVYGYYCTSHGSEDGSGMAGAIWVTP